MLLAFGDIEPNPGPRKRSTCCNFSICNWNLNSITAHNFEKVDLLEAYNTFKKIDIICLSELSKVISLLEMTTLMPLIEAEYVYTSGNPCL